LKRLNERWLSVILVVLGLAATLTGLLSPSIYRDPSRSSDCRSSP